MSPEQIQGTKLDHRTDIYSLGITLYEMVTGRVAFNRAQDSDSDYSILTAHTNQPPPSPREFVPQLPVYLGAAILKALAKKPEERFQNCREFQKTLGLELEPAADMIAEPATEPLAPADLLPSLSVSTAPPEGAVSNDRPTSPPSLAPQEPEVQPRTARLATMDKSRRVWPWAVALMLIVVAFVGLVGWRFRGGRGGYELKQTLSGHQGAVTSVAFSPDGRLLASGSVDRTIKLWDVATRRLKQTLSGHENYVQSVAFSPDGHLLASGNTDKTIKLPGVASGNLKQTLKWNGNSVLSVAFSPD